AFSSRYCSRATSVVPFLLTSLLPFFFYCSRAHLDLHSFPTRRSSDLAVPGRAAADAALQWLRRAGREPVSGHGSATVLLNITQRSEEHTSELQSQSNLVCRLLLEKKKKK